jgi:hypothetical protein
MRNLAELICAAAYDRKSDRRGSDPMEIKRGCGTAIRLGATGRTLARLSIACFVPTKRKCAHLSELVANALSSRLAVQGIRSIASDDMLRIPDEHSATPGNRPAVRSGASGPHYWRRRRYRLTVEAAEGEGWRPAEGYRAIAPLRSAVAAMAGRNDPVPIAPGECVHVGAAVYAGGWGARRSDCGS